MAQQDSMDVTDKFWPELSAGVDIILSKAGEGFETALYVQLYTDVYNFCTALKSWLPGGAYYTPADTSSSVHGSVYGRQLYTRLNDHVTQWMLKVAERAAEHTGDDLLTFYNQEWNKYGDAAKTIHNIFDYLNRHWIQREQEEGNNVCDINTLMFRLWRNNFFMNVRNSLLESVFSLLKRIRGGQVADLNLVKSVVDSFVALGSEDTVYSGNKKMEVYDSYFLKPFIESSKQHYEAEAERVLQEGSIRNYMVWIWDKLLEEDERAVLCLHESSLREFSEALNKVLIGKQRAKLTSEFKPMLEAQEREGLKRLYQLMKRLGESVGLDPLRDIFGDFVKEAGMEAVKKVSSDKDATESIANKSRMFVNALISVHDLYASILRESFESDPGFNKALDHACKEYMNINAICVSPETNAARLLANYCDALLKKGNANTRVAGAAGASSEDNMEQQLSQVICVFRYLKDQDIFQEAYWRFLARRLVNEQSVSSHGEETMISKLKEVSGVDFTSRLTRMFTDITMSREMVEQFNEPGKAQLPFDFDMKVLNTGSWPFKVPDTKLKLPSELDRAVDQYTEFYQSKHNGRRLNWLWQYSKAEIKMFFPKATGSAAKAGYLFQVSTYQLAILLLFNADSGPGTGYDSEDGPTLTFDQIVTATELTKEAVAGELEVFCKARVLNSSADNKISEDASFTLNSGFKSKRLRINLSGLKKPEQKRESNDIQSTINVDRMLNIQAAIVRIMKARKQLSHRELIEATISHIKLFQPQIADIKQAIDKNIDGGYLERDENNRDLYNYLA
ncbi:Cullin-domain-containing protein [Coemansia reversa NRRL 1564]|uniref:Cullin-5 n=1 Tax=Coemansia reversa (strain ATCC 12441 / NRRL 1564) TaxID=763665 RepID=A0A2G5B907_COERN|nr:Cullin-domain-containing protein [Coemansia reversa NRRL 1564]|eukprot:PIA15499.1 Cullin-domain-containing protein [Coemansia reversa NRRL 1564]